MRHEVQKDDLRDLYERLLDRSSATVRHVVVGGRRVFLIEQGDGPILVLLHGTGNSSLFFRPLLGSLEGVRTIIPDRPGQGLSAPAELPRRRYREAAVAWVDGLLDALDLTSASLLGHSMCGLWSLWYALAHPDRVERLVLVGPPQLPGTRVPLPYRAMATPGVDEVLQRSAPPTRRSVLRFARFMREDQSLPRHPDMIELLVAGGRDPVAARTDLAETRAIISLLALLSPAGFRRRMRVRADELRRLTIPTLLLWGEHDPLGGPAVAEEVSDLLPHAELEVLPAGHAPWLGHPHRVAAAVTGFVRGGLAQAA